MYICMYIYMYVYIYSHTHEHARARTHTHICIYYTQVDILSNRALSHLWGISGRHVYEYPARDESTQRLLTSGDVFGILYCESPAMRKALRVLQPASRRGTQFTCLTGAKVQILTPQALRRAGAGAGTRVRTCLLVQKYLLC
jgi:hypothetical protein